MGSKIEGRRRNAMLHNRLVGSRWESKSRARTVIVCAQNNVRGVHRVAVESTDGEFRRIMNVDSLVGNYRHIEDGDDEQR